MFGLNWLDIVVVVVLVIGVIDGVTKGFIVSFFNIAGIFISLYLSRFLMVYCADFLIKSTSIYENLKNMFHQRVSKLDTLTTGVIRLLNIKESTLADSITRIFISAACFLILFILSTIIINILKNILKEKIKKTPLMQIDKLLGGMIGFVTAAVFVFVIFAVIIPVTTVLPKSNALVVAINTSQLGKYFYYFNFIVPWLQNATKEYASTTTTSATAMIFNFINYYQLLK